MKRLAAAVATLGLVAGCLAETDAPDTTRTTDGQRSEGRVQAGRSQDGYSFTRTRPNGDPVRWSACRPIEYVVRTRNQPPGAQRLLRESIRRTSRATGLEFSNEGTTDEAPRDDRPIYQPERYGDRWVPVLITYSNPEEYPRLAGGPVGYGGAAYVRQDGATARYVSGMAVFDAERLSSLSDAAVRGVMVHELAHVVGLGHVDDPGQLMNPVQYGHDVTTLQEGDREGLKILGAGRCYEPLEPRSLR